MCKTQLIIYTKVDNVFIYEYFISKIVSFKNLTISSQASRKKVLQIT